jgi:hypothetical protein
MDTEAVLTKWLDDFAVARGFRPRMIPLTLTEFTNLLMQQPRRMACEIGPYTYDGAVMRVFKDGVAEKVRDWGLLTSP